MRPENGRNYSNLGLKNNDLNRSNPKKTAKIWFLIFILVYILCQIAIDIATLRIPIFEINS